MRWAITSIAVAVIAPGFSRPAENSSGPARSSPGRRRRAPPSAPPRRRSQRIPPRHRLPTGRRQEPTRGIIRGCRGDRGDRSHCPPDPHRTRPTGIGRRIDDPERGFEHTITLLGDADLRIDSSTSACACPGHRSGNRGAASSPSPAGSYRSRSDLDRRQTPTLRHGEVLVADSERIDGWRNLGQAETVLLWIVTAPLRRSG